ncbi:hypothetical protein WG31_12365 [Acetobacter oryzifermentans]|uniref:Secreted protein n=1 Tax=Acetobacter oryzifermentans TaxID=1633874 RepID=A0ABM6AM10_9PROT|nr:hypothetical protein WG31_12365 [Acetobacter oryzifermentans]
MFYAFSACAHRKKSILKSIVFACSVFHAHVCGNFAQLLECFHASCIQAVAVRFCNVMVGAVWGNNRIFGGYENKVRA